MGCGVWGVGCGVWGVIEKVMSLTTTDPPFHQQCDVNYREIRRAAVWSYEFHRRINGRVPPAEGTRPYEKLTIPTDLAIVRITLLVVVQWRPGVG